MVTDSTLDTPAGERHGFRAEVTRLLDLMAHAVYKDRDVFLRELISNAADACERLRYEALQRPDLLGDDPDLAVTLRLDGDTLAVEDNGIGMNRAELDENLGTIARSGTRAFLDSLPEGGAGQALIGQFGIGFYSAFMVADRVEVLSRKAGESEGWRWSSDGKGEFTLEPSEDAPSRGTVVRLHLKEDAKAYADAGAIEAILREHSAHVTVPIRIAEGAGEPRQVAGGTALWRKPKSEITPEQHRDFYAHVSGQFDEPALTLHWKAEGRQEYTVLAYVPSTPPLDLFDPTRKGRMRLYVRRVFITEDAALVPGYLRFLRGVVDSEDLPLNLSRETLQETAAVAAIRKAITNRVLAELEKTAESAPETFGKVWEAFGSVLKEGLYEDPERRDALYRIARFRTSRDAGWRSLKDYVADLRPNQTEIYYLAGESLAQIEASPLIEGFRARGIEVLLLPDPVDSFWVTRAIGYDGKPFRSISQGEIDLSAIPLLDESAAEDAAPRAKLATLTALMKQTLGDAVDEVRVSARLATSAACLVAGAGSLDRRLEKLLAGQGQAPRARPPVLELNPRHPLVKRLADKAAEGAGANLDDAIWLVFDVARVLDGEAPREPRCFAERMQRLLAEGLA